MPWQITEAIQIENMDTEKLMNTRAERNQTENPARNKANFYLSIVCSLVSAVESALLETDYQYQELKHQKVKTFRKGIYERLQVIILSCKIEFFEMELDVST